MAQLFFKSTPHRARLQEAIQQIDKVYEEGKLDVEYASALYILTSTVAMWQRTQSYVHRHGIGFDEILQDINFSSGEERLVRLAASLFNDTQHIDPVEFVHLDDANFTIALQAIKIRRNGVRVADLIAPTDTNPHQLSDGFIGAVTGEITQERTLTLIEQAMKEVDAVTPVQVQVWLVQHGVDLPIEQVAGNMKIVSETIDGEGE